MWSQPSMGKIPAAWHTWKLRTKSRAAQTTWLSQSPGKAHGSAQPSTGGSVWAGRPQAPAPRHVRCGQAQAGRSIGLGFPQVVPLSLEFSWCCSECGRLSLGALHFHLLQHDQPKLGGRKISEVLSGKMKWRFLPGNHWQCTRLPLMPHHRKQGVGPRRAK